jgi:hypothetical protein
MKPPFHLISLGALTLAACQGDDKAAEARTAQGEILPASASDAMLPLDTVRSQPPLAPLEVASGRPVSAGTGKPAARRSTDGESDGGAGGPSKAAPAATPRVEVDTSVAE